MNYLDIIDKKLNEHKIALENSTELKEQLKTELLKGKEQLKNKDPNSIVTAAHVLAMADKVRFHEICIKCLEDFKKDISNVD